MKINENVWKYGGESALYKTNDMTFSPTLSTLISSKVLSYNIPYDNTATLWACAKDALVPHLYYWNDTNFVDIMGGVQEDYMFPMLAYNTTNGVMRGLPFIGDSKIANAPPMKWMPDATSNTYNDHAEDGRICIDFNYNQLVMVIYCDVVKDVGISTETRVISITLKEWKNTYSDYTPYAVYFKPRYKNSTNLRNVRFGITFNNYFKYNGKYYLMNPGAVAKTNGYNFPVLGTSAYSQSYENASSAWWVNGKVYGDVKMTASYNRLLNPESNYQWYSLVIDDYDNIIKKCLKLGFICSVSEVTTIDNEDVYIPIINNGKVTSEYTQGENNSTNPMYNIANPFDNIDFNPNNIDPNEYTENIDLNTPNLTTTGVFNRSFAMTGNNLDNLANYLWNADESIFDEIVKGLSLMGNNPIDALIDLRLYPFDVATKAGGGTSQSIVVGRTDTGVHGLIINSYNAILDLGYCTFHKHFNNFLDYEPFTTASLYIPYVGIVPISTADFAGNTISVKMIVDITTGGCTAIVYNNGIPQIYKNGNIGIDIPMTATNSSQYAGRMLSGLTSGVTDVIMGATTGNVPAVLSGMGELANSALNVNNTIYNTAGSSSPSCSLWQPQNCYFMIHRPVPIVPENYGHNVGYACNYSSLISECSGYTQTYNVDVSTINAPENEKSMIADILNNGFYA